MTLEYLTVEHLNTKDLIRIFSKVSINLDAQWNGIPCWEWTASLTHKGYGQLAFERRPNGQMKMTTAHRVMYAWLVGPVPRGQSHGEIDHLCKNRKCCNPSHLEFVPVGVNTLRGNGPSAQHARKTHCDYGHELTSENTYNTKKKGRQCKICGRRRGKKDGALYYKRHKESLLIRWRKKYQQRKPYYQSRYQLHHTSDDFPVKETQELPH